MLFDFIYGWCGSVPISILIAWLIRHHGNPPPPPEPWPILFSNVLAGLVALGVGAAGFKGGNDFSAVIFPMALGVVTASLVGLFRTGRGTAA